MDFLDNKNSLTDSVEAIDVNVFNSALMGGWERVRAIWI
jgi:hypothetical protein